MHDSRDWVRQHRCAWTDECLSPGLNTGIGYTDNGIPWKSHAGVTAGTLYLGNCAAVTQRDHKADSAAVQSGFLSGGDRKSPFSLKTKPFQTMHIPGHALYCGDMTSQESCSTDCLTSQLQFSGKSLSYWQKKTKKPNQPTNKQTNNNNPPQSNKQTNKNHSRKKTKPKTPTGKSCVKKMGRHREGQNPFFWMLPLHRITEPQDQLGWKIPMRSSNLTHD